jgi:hypothetical protein
MIDLEKETPIPMVQGAKLMHCSYESCWRWVFHGVKTENGKVRLRAAKVGGKWFTSTQAIAEFIEKTTPKFGDEAAPAPCRSQLMRQKAAERAAARLEALGA